jgi:hypothetical protein
VLLYGKMRDTSSNQTSIHENIQDVFPLGNKYALFRTGNLYAKKIFKLALIFDKEFIA